MAIKVVTYEFLVQVQVPDTDDGVSDALAAVEALGDHLRMKSPHEVLRVGSRPRMEPSTGAVRQFSLREVRRGTIAGVTDVLADADSPPPLTKVISGEKRISTTR